jgi:hypothetical protein
MSEKEKTYQEHHPSRELFPDFTLRLPSWMHLTVRRLEQMNPTEQNFMDICSMSEAVDWVKKLMFARMYGNQDGE